MLHIHVFLVAPLGVDHMAQSGTDQHEGRVSVREGPHHASPAANLPVQPLNHVVSADPGRLYCRLTSFSRSLQINLRITLDGTHTTKAGHSLLNKAAAPSFFNINITKRIVIDHNPLFCMSYDDAKQPARN